MLNLILDADFISQTPTLYFRGRSNHHTYFGGTLSILFTLLLLSILTYLLIVLLERNDYSITLVEEYNIKNAYINLTNQDHAIGLVDKLGRPFADQRRLFTIKGLYWKLVMTISPNNSETEALTVPYPIELEHCNITQFSKPELWKDEPPINIGYCVKKNQYVDTSRIYGYDNYTSMSFWIQKCTNNSEFDNCYPEEVIQESLANCFVAYKYIDHYVDHNLNGNPFVPFVNTILKPASISVYKRTFLSYRNIEFLDDIDYIYTMNKDKFESYNLAETSESIDLRPLNSTTVVNSFYTLTMSGYQLKQKFYRRYYKASDLIGDFGGVMQVLTVFFYLINWIFKRNDYPLALVNSNLNNYHFDSEKFNGNIPSLSKSPFKQSINSILPPTITIEVRKKLARATILRKNKIFIHWLYKLYPLFCIDKHTLAGKLVYLYRKYYEIVKRQLDIGNLVNRINTVEKLSYIYFGKDLENVDIIPNPYLNDADEMVAIGNNEICKFNEMCYRNYRSLMNKFS
jgi:hypothetical protein